ncbi:hypothetical protein CYY_006147 [Polysphondylium violaceum]|uniref:FNIP repeat-containing protein n=1 Tax=Polysphondylium violaceum TaxID=133409 RepID=A0A8J4PT52_9MYCE|nr:hypothetical protein CYY_006147 [Polysphondylium violaceum]
MDTLFYSVWRNTILRKDIRKKVCQNLLIDINLEYLNDNHQYISLLSLQDKIDYNIYFKLFIKEGEELKEYYNNPHKHLVDDIKIHHFNRNKNVPPEENIFDADIICYGVRRLLLHEDHVTNVRGRLPPTITELYFNGDNSKLTYNLRFGNKELDAMISSLPNLRKLVLPNNYQVTDKIELPSTLVEFKHQSSCDNLRKITVTPTTPIQLKGCEVNVEDLDDLAWFRDKPWYTNLEIIADGTITRGAIPQHVTKLTFPFYQETRVEEGAIPAGLEELDCPLTIPLTIIKGLGHLKILNLHSASQPLEKDLLPKSLESFSIYKDNLPFLPDVLPQGLKNLQSTHFDLDLQVGSLPHSLKKLEFSTFDQKLDPFVLPSSLTWLNMFRFTGKLVKNSLPSSLQVLKLNSFTGSFEFVEPLPELFVLQVDTLQPSVTNLFSKHNINSEKRVKITFKTIGDQVSLQDLPIQHLHLYNGHMRSTLSAKLVPKRIKSLRLNGLDIKSSGLIPNSCIYLEASNKDAVNFIPSTTKHTLYNPIKYAHQIN